MADRAASASPIVVTTPQELRSLTAGWRRADELVGLVPTMGALHVGHRALIEAARRACDRVVVSIFVNPLQFGPGLDYPSYPQPLEEDLEQLAQLGVDACYHPAVATLYPKGFATRVSVSSGGDLWEAASRPGHLVGVATVVAKLFAATGLCRAYFGEKDAQQVAVVSSLARDLDTGVEVVVCPTVRDPDGLAASSRNQLLSPAGREAALSLSRALIKAGETFASGVVSGAELSRAAAEVVESEPRARLDYAAVVDPVDFQPVEVARSESRVMVAAKVEAVRLIDTALLGSPPQPSG
ncbi:MAG TPA: pantoate--beta-alanine ligase [Candidatus Saccharimonadales bacterium]|nr:pantoate--beta-alanine ligase [Candidatus Saccharimonadales bacterium]